LLAQSLANSLARLISLPHFIANENDRDEVDTEILSLRTREVGNGIAKSVYVWLTVHHSRNSEDTLPQRKCPLTMCNSAHLLVRSLAKFKCAPHQLIRTRNQWVFQID
jgi:hypothetical protein